jgi:two-component system CheB/CheR fusion protein
VDKHNQTDEAEVLGVGPGGSPDDLRSEDFEAPGDDEGETGQASFPLVIGIAAAATGEDALLTLIELIDGEDAAVILCLSRQDQANDDALYRRVGERARRPAVAIEDGAAIERGKIYIVPAAAVATLEDGRFTMRSSPEPMGERGRTDTLLVSIAEAQNAHAVAIVLAGLGGDGTLGATALKEYGGLVIAQETEETGRNQTLTLGAASAIADLILPVERIAEAVSDYQRHLTAMQRDHDARTEREHIAGQLGRIAAVLRNKTGHDFHGYKQNTFLRRVQRRMQVQRATDVEAYIAILRDDAEEPQQLFNDMLIGVTQFFRDAREFDILEREVIPKLFEGKGAGDQVRAWVLGCATGEEAYSLAIMMREHMAGMDAVPHVQIFATDIDGRALAAARVGRFAETIARDVSPERLARWFVREGDTYCVVKELREMCIFSQHNLIKDAPFSRLDLVSCRNLLIYLNNELQNRVIPLFHFALLPGGHLFLGNSENVTRHSKLFAPLDRRFRIFRKLETSTRILPDFPLSPVADRRSGASGGTRTRVPEGTLAKRAERIAERYAPAYVVVDEDYEALHFSGRTGRYLDPTSGAATLSLVNLVHRDLRLDLRAALNKAAAENKAVIVPPVRMANEDETIVVHLAVEPVTAGSGEATSFLVLFRDGEALADGDDGEVASPLIRDEHVQRLEGDLRITRERLQATIEELESTNEELKSSNEEYQSINEELQSANEELETSKEELQSVNEELQTVNGELAHRVQDLGKANSDLKNLLESTQIATVFLDNDLRVKTFTPSVTEIIHLIESDLGRSITHIAGKISYDEIAEDVRRVMRTLTTVEREIADRRSGARYLVRILPYRSLDNFIAGVVITFLDVTATAKAETALRVSEERFRSMAQAVPIILFTADVDFGFDYVNARFYEITGMASSSALGHGWLAGLHPDDIDRVQSEWRVAADENGVFECECRMRDANGGFRWMLIRSDAVRDAHGAFVRWSGSAADVDALRLATDRQKMLMAELQHRVKNILAVTRSIFTRTFAAGNSLEEVADHFTGRLNALARAQTVVARTPEGSVDLEELVRDELLSLGIGDGPNLTIDGPPVRLRQKAVDSMGLAIHELATNAVKYGAFASRKGSLKIVWSVQDKGGGARLSLEWQESGVALLATNPSRRGFGRELIEQALPYQLGATTALDFLPGGVRCSINTPLAALDEDSAADRAAEGA